MLDKVFFEKAGAAARSIAVRHRLLVADIEVFFQHVSDCTLAGEGHNVSLDEDLPKLTGDVEEALDEWIQEVYGKLAQ